jgi:hypothetical protein
VRVLRWGVRCLVHELVIEVARLRPFRDVYNFIKQYLVSSVPYFGGSGVAIYTKGAVLIVLMENDFYHLRPGRT